MSQPTAKPAQSGFLGVVERVGNRLPDPVFLFLYLIAILIVISIVCSLLGVSAVHPTQLAADGSAVLISSESLLSAANLQNLWVDMPKTFTHFHPLGYVLVVMLGAGVAERSGLFASAIRAAVRGAPRFLLTPVVALVAMISNHAADAGYVVLIPLAAVLFASSGRHPLAGIAAAFAGVSGGFSANISPGQLDALLFGITETAVEGSGISSGWSMNIAGNTYFIIALLFLYLPIIWYVTDRIIEPRLGKWIPDQSKAAEYADEDRPLTAAQRTGLNRAGLACLVVIGFWILMTVGPGTPLLLDGPDHADMAWYERLNPLFRSLVAGFMILFLAAGWAYGAAAGTINNHRDLVGMMTEAMKDMGYYSRARVCGGAFRGDVQLVQSGPHHGGARCRCHQGQRLAARNRARSGRTLYQLSESVRRVRQRQVGIACTGAGADADVVRCKSGGSHGRLPRRRWRHQHHHATDGVLSIDSDLRAALAKRLRAWQPDSHDAALQFVATRGGRLIDDRLGIIGYRSRTGGTRALLIASVVCTE